MRRVLILLVAGTLVSGLAAAYAGASKRGGAAPAATLRPASAPES